MASLTYNSNPQLKATNVNVPYTQEQIEEYIKCANDPVYFIDNYCHIIHVDHGIIPFKLYDCQKNKINIIHNNRKVILMEGRQQGKTQTSAAYILWYTNFHDAKNVAILANKASAAREVMSRYQMMFELLPSWLQQGVKTWNKGDIELENMSKVFTAATTGAGIRGKTCVTGDTRVCILENDSVYYSEISKIINNSIFINIKDNMKKYTVYKTTNLINGKIYIGFHSILESDIVRTDYGHISCFKDGYLGSGKLIIKAIEKYGPENFAQEILGIFDSKEEAEDLERNLVSKEFVDEEANYNLSIGGNVTILFGDKNGFYNKQHTKESLSKIQESRKQSNLPTYQCIVTDLETNVEFKGYTAALSYYGYEDSNINNSNKKRIFLGELVYKNIIKISNEEFSKNLVECYLEHYNINTQEHIDYIKSEQAEVCRERFTGKKQSSEQIKLRVEGRAEWIKNNPEQHKNTMDSINKNPEKIQKTADKHRGMKRSEQTKQNISNALLGKIPSNKGKFMAYNSETLEVNYFTDLNELPIGWVKGSSRINTPAGKKSYTDGKSFKMYIPGDQPNGWYLGAPKKNKK